MAHKMHGFDRECLIDCIKEGMPFKTRQELIDILEEDGKTELEDLERLGESKYIGQYNLDERKKAIEALKRSLAEDEN